MIPLRNIRRFSRKALEQPGYALSVGLKRARAYGSYYLGRGAAPPAEAVTIFLTHKCNLRCRMCGQWGDKGVTRHEGGERLLEELSLEELKKFIDGVARTKTNITLFGGEPLLHRHAIELIRHIKAKNLHCLAITNGSLLAKLAADIVDAGLDELNISLDGSEAAHDRIRGMSGLFRRIADGINAVNALKEKNGRGKPLINLQCTINRDNYENLGEMLDVAAGLKVNSVTFHHLIFLREETCAEQDTVMQTSFPGTRSDAWRGFVFEPGMDTEALIRKIQDIRTRPTSFFVNFFPNLSDAEIRTYYADPRSVPRSYATRCVSPWIVAYLFPDGEIRPCLNVSYAFGNIRNSSFGDIWNSEAARRYRTTLKKKRIFPACVRCTELFRY